MRTRPNVLVIVVSFSKGSRFKTLSAQAVKQTVVSGASLGWVEVQQASANERTSHYKEVAVLGKHEAL